jgi:hypothetical protein
MSKTLQITLITVAVLLAGAALLFTGINLGRAQLAGGSWSGWMMNFRATAPFAAGAQGQFLMSPAYSGQMMDDSYGHGMMGMMNSAGIGLDETMGEMMANNPSLSDIVDLPVTPSQAVETAQRYLDTYLPGAQADTDADPFYGYYTLHIVRAGETVGMLSVNGLTGQVFVHSWHGQLLEMDEGT